MGVHVFVDFAEGQVGDSAFVVNPLKMLKSLQFILLLIQLILFRLKIPQRLPQYHNQVNMVVLLVKNRL